MADIDILEFGDSLFVTQNKKYIIRFYFYFRRRIEVDSLVCPNLEDLSLSFLVHGFGENEDRRVDQSGCQDEVKIIAVRREKCGWVKP